MTMLEHVLLQLNPPHLLASTDVKKAVYTAKEAERDALTATIWLSLVTFIDKLYAQYPLVAAASTAGSALSRHAIQHGCREPPNECLEAIRLLHTIETALSLHEEILVSITPKKAKER